MNVYSMHHLRSHCLNAYISKVIRREEYLEKLHLFSMFWPRADPCHFLLNQLARVGHMNLPLQESL